MKCGRSQHNWKQRWKITRLECRLKHVPQDQWLSQPSGSFHLNPNRIRQLVDHTARLNRGGHRLRWNVLLGKDFGAANEGLLHCSRCSRLPLQVWSNFWVSSILFVQAEVDSRIWKIGNAGKVQKMVRNRLQFLFRDMFSTLRVSLIRVYPRKPRFEVFGELQKDCTETH